MAELELVRQEIIGLLEEAKDRIAKQEVYRDYDVREHQAVEEVVSELKATLDKARADIISLQTKTTETDDNAQQSTRTVNSMLQRVEELEGTVMQLADVVI